jgi:hypothetical protein
MIEIVHRRICDHCGRFDDYRMKHYFGNEADIPAFPDGWRVIEGKVYCDNHIITIDVKTKKRRGRE